MSFAEAGIACCTLLLAACLAKTRLPNEGSPPALTLDDMRAVSPALAHHATRRVAGFLG